MLAELNLDALIADEKAADEAEVWSLSYADQRDDDLAALMWSIVGGFDGRIDQVLV
jgi:hypothetical protein